MCDMGAEVVVVEPPGGAATRSYEPFVDDQPDPERSLFWWHYNAGKLSVALDLSAGDDADRFRRLAAEADIVLEAEPPGVMASADLDYGDLRRLNDRLVMVSITPLGRSGASEVDEPTTDLTLLAAGGPVWSCGYDDHSLPPVRGGGCQASHIACHFAVMSTLVALLVREETGAGQHVDVN